MPTIAYKERDLGTPVKMGDEIVFVSSIAYCDKSVWVPHASDDAMFKAAKMMAPNGYDFMMYPDPEYYQHGPVSQRATRQHQPRKTICKPRDYCKAALRALVQWALGVYHWARGQRGRDGETGEGNVQ